MLLAEGRLEVRDDLPDPVRPGEVPVEVLLAGVCSTDLALGRGYMGFRGTPGHEFVGRALEGPLAGRRVVGEINASCGVCADCRAGRDRHCPTRTVLGILDRPGAFATRLCLPARNLVPVPDGVSDREAVFTEPLAAALQIATQVPMHPGSRALVAGDGRLGLLCAWALHRCGLEVVVAGRHPEHQALLDPSIRLETGLLESEDATPTFDLAVEATGRPEALERLLRWVRPLGTVVIKTTSERSVPLDLARVVVDEITLVGSRCGRFAPALEALAEHRIPVEDMIDCTLPLAQVEEAFRRAAEPGVLKVLLDPGAR